MLQHPQRRTKVGQSRQILRQRRRAAEIQHTKTQEIPEIRLTATNRVPNKISPRSQPQNQQRYSKDSTGKVRALRSQPMPNTSRVRAHSAQRVQRRRLPAAEQGGLFLLRNCLKIGILGLGLSAIVGTVITILHPEPRSSTLANSLIQTGQKDSAATETSFNPALAAGSGISPLGTTPILSPDKELKSVKAKILSLAAAQTALTPGLFVYNPDTGAYLDIAGDKAFSAASTIKFPVLVAFFQEIDAKHIKPDELLTMRKDLVAPESGDIQYQPVGTKFGALETANLMITISDNTATNMLIDRLGGMETLNQRFKSWGLMQTAIRNPLPDLQGTNTISPKDLSALMLKVAQGELLSPHSRDLALEMMRNTVTNTLLSPGLGEGAKIAHKTGDIGSVVGDVGLIEMPSGQHYVATAMVERPHNDPRAQELIRQMSRLTYQALNQPTTVSVPETISAVPKP